MNGIIASIKSKAIVDHNILNDINHNQTKKIIENNINQPWANDHKYLDLLDYKKYYNLDYVITFNPYSIDYDLILNDKKIFTHNDKNEVEYYLISNFINPFISNHSDYSIYYEWIDKNKIDYIIVKD